MATQWHAIFFPFPFNEWAAVLLDAVKYPAAPLPTPLTAPLPGLAAVLSPVATAPPIDYRTLPRSDILDIRFFASEAEALSFIGEHSRFVSFGAAMVELDVAPTVPVPASVFLEGLVFTPNAVGFTLIGGTSPRSLTLTATGTVALLGVVQTFTAQQTVDTSTNPMLYLNGPDNASASLFIDSYGTSGISQYVGRNALGTRAAKTTLTSGVAMVRLAGYGWDGSAYGIGSFIDIIASETWNGTSHGSRVNIRTVPNGSVTSAIAFRVLEAGGAQVLVSGLQVGLPTGGDKGDGTVNAAGFYYGNGTIGVTAGSFSTITAITTTKGIVTQLTGSSDERLKDIYGPFIQGLSALRSIVPIRFSWNERSGFPRDAEWIGFSAQNVAAVLPEALGVEVWADGSTWLTLNDRAILATTVNAIQELEQRLVALEQHCHA